MSQYQCPHCARILHSKEICYCEGARAATKNFMKQFPVLPPMTMEQAKKEYEEAVPAPYTKEEISKMVDNVVSGRIKP